MRLPQYLTAALLLSISLSSQANVIWDYQLGSGIQGQFVTTGNFVDARDFTSPTAQSLFFDIIGFSVISSMDPQVPSTVDWSFNNDASLEVTYGFLPNTRQYTINNFIANAILEFPINVMGVDLILPLEQTVFMDNSPAVPGDAVTVQDIVNCADDISVRLNAGLAASSDCRNSGFPAGFRSFSVTPISSTASAVPEPSSLALLGLGALGLIRRARRKQL